MRAVAVIILFLAATFVVLWQLDVIKLGSNQGTNKQTQNFLEVVQTGTLEQVKTALAANAVVTSQDREGKTPLMYAAMSNTDPRIITELVNAGADLNARSDSGLTALMYAARDNNNPETVLALLNAGADPTIQDNETKNVYDHAGNNGTLRRTRIYNRLEDLVAKPFNPLWPSGYISPLDGGTFSSRVSHLPNTLRAYRNGIHQGFDFFNGTVSLPVEYSTPAIAVADGTITRIDHVFTEMTQAEYDQLIQDAASRPITPEDSLDKLRGQQVWIEHVGGFVSRYAHLSGVVQELKVGDEVRQGQVVGYVGNSGTSEAAANTRELPHLHYELWRGVDTFMGEGLDAAPIYTLVAQVFGGDAAPDRWGN
ncbi:MAG: peptidoglycan DD-metalloendopeptidase family protein [Deinococcales bacterium]